MWRWWRVRLSRTALWNPTLGIVDNHAAFCSQIWMHVPALGVDCLVQFSDPSNIGIGGASVSRILVLDDPLRLRSWWCIRLWISHILRAEEGLGWTRRGKIKRCIYGVISKAFLEGTTKFWQLNALQTLLQERTSFTNLTHVIDQILMSSHVILHMHTLPHLVLSLLLELEEIIAAIGFQTMRPVVLVDFVSCA